MVLFIIAVTPVLIALPVAYTITTRREVKAYYAGRRGQINGAVDRDRTGEYVHGVIDQMLEGGER